MGQKLPECIANVEFKTDDKTIWYSADNGYFCDIINNCFITVDDDTRSRVNELFGVSESEKSDTKKETVMYIYQYDWDFSGVSYKTIRACEEASALIEALNSAKKTGEIAEKIADEVCDSFRDHIYSISLPVETGTKWIEADGKLYRISRDYKQLCIVNSYLGAGEVLELTEELSDMIKDMKSYWPNNVYYGEYDKSNNEITLKHSYSANSSVDIKITEIDVKFKYHYTKNKITLELISDIYQITEVDVWSYKSEDNHLDGARRNVPLRAGTNVEEFSFGSDFVDYFWLSIISGNTRIELKIQM